MKPTRPAKRSVSPFASSGGDVSPLGTLPSSDALSALRQAVESVFGPSTPPAVKLPKSLKTPDDFHLLPAFLKKVTDAPANDAPELSDLCRFLLLFRGGLEEKNLLEPVVAAMEQLFDRKTDIFLVDHHDKVHCEKMGWPEEYRDVVLFAKERDILVGRFFAPLTEAHPGKFSEFISRWAESDNRDRILHFLDFCAGSKNPTFEHYLLFTHPALSRLMRDKTHLKSLFDKTQPLLKKFTSPTWEKDVRSALAL